MIYKEICLDKEVIVRDPQCIPVNLTSILEKKMLFSNSSH